MSADAINPDFLLSVVIPIYNEESTLETILERVRATPYRKEIVMVDDCSTDGTREILKRLEADDDLKIFYHEKNKGKGGALATGFAQVTGDIVLIQDADLEYDPEEYPILLKPILDGHADVVYGSRFLGGGAQRVHLFWHRLGNVAVTLMSNIFTNLNLTDMETCYKVFKGEVLSKITLKSKRFGVEPEITAKVARLRCRIYEVPISYHGRDYDEGKKITWRDGLAAIFHIIRFRLFR
jgi:glycosyltransferase involved in cell wall biosynthesis